MPGVVFTGVRPLPWNGDFSLSNARHEQRGEDDGYVFHGRADYRPGAHAIWTVTL